MKVLFSDTRTAYKFMTMLMDNNNQGVKQTIYNPICVDGEEKAVWFSYNNVIHQDLYKNINDFIDKYSIDDDPWFYLED